MDVDIKIDGLRELERKLIKLGGAAAEKHLNAALMNASLPMFKEAKNRAPGSIKTAIQRRKTRTGKRRKISVKGIRNTGSAAASVNLIVNKKLAPHAHLLEFGTKKRTTKGVTRSDMRKGRKKKYSAGANRGLVKPVSFMTKALDNNQSQFFQRFQKNLKRRVERAVK